MNTSVPITFPFLTTERSVLRQLTTIDEPGIFKLRSDNRVNAFLDRPRMQSIEEAGFFIQKINNGIDHHEWLYWAIVLKNEPSILIGTICLWNFSGDRSVAEIGYELNPDMQGKGIMQEVIKTVIDHGFNKIKLKMIKAYTHFQNDRSARLLEKFNFKIKVNREAIDGDEAGLKNMIIYILRSMEWDHA